MIKAFFLFDEHFSYISVTPKLSEVHSAELEEDVYKFERVSLK